LNDTNYVAVLSKATNAINATDLRLPTLSSLGLTNSRAVATYGLELDGQRLSFSVSSPYFVVPGVEGSTLTVSALYRSPSGRDGQHLSVALLRVDSIDGDLSALLATSNLASRLISIPANGALQLQAGDILLPVLFQGIDPLRWAALPADQRLTGTGAAGWSVTLADPALDPSALLRRRDASTYGIGLDGLLALHFGATLQASLGTAATIVGNSANTTLTSGDPSHPLNFAQDLIITGDGAHTVDPANISNAGNNILLLGNGDDGVHASQDDVVFTGGGRDQISLSQDGANRIDAGSDDDSIVIGVGEQRVVGGDGNDSFSFSAPIAASVVLSGGPGADAFWLTTTTGAPLGAAVVINDFDASQGDRLILPDTAYGDLSFQQIGSDVQISKGNTPLALLRNRTLDQIANPTNFNLQPLASQPQVALTQSLPDPIADPNFGNKVLQPSDVISDGVNGLAAFARKVVGSTLPQLRVYLHTTAKAVTIGGGKSGQQTINTVAIDDNTATWMRNQLCTIAATLNIDLTFVTDKAQSNLDIYDDSAISLASDRSTLGITLANDNGKQSWWEVLLNASMLSADPSGFRYAFTHELGHVLGLEHPFDNSDGDAVGQRFGLPDTGTTLMSYSQSSSGWPDHFQLIDWAALVSLWGLNAANTSGWRFRSADGSESVLNAEQAQARLAALQSGDGFLGRADGLLSYKPSTGATSTTLSNTDSNTNAASNENSNVTPAIVPIIKTTDTSSSTSNNVNLPLIVDNTPAALSATPGHIDWLPIWRQLDLELGVALDTNQSLQLVSPATYALTPSDRLVLTNLDLSGSNEADVLFASAGSSLDLGLGQDTIFSRSPHGGYNHLYGGEQGDRFFLASPGDVVYGGIRLSGTTESASDSAANTFLIDGSARPSGYLSDANAAITIADFQPGLDSITLINGNAEQTKALPICASNYIRYRDSLQTEQNIILNAAPVSLVAKRGLLITDAMLSAGFRIKASDFFYDPDVPLGGTPNLSFVGYNNDLPWLTASNGDLVVAPQSNVAPGSYSLSLAASDGLSRSPLTNINVSVAPKVSIGDISVPAGASLQFQFTSSNFAAIELLVQTLDINGLPLTQPIPIAGQVGSSSGTPSGFDGMHSNAVAGDLFASGQLAFFLRRPGTSSALLPMKIKASSPQGFSLLADDGTKVLATVSNQPAAELFTCETSIAGVPALGLNIPNPAAPATPLVHKVSVAYELYREASFNSTVGFYLADRITGAVIDNVTGEFLTGPAIDDKGSPNPNYRAVAAAHTLLSATVANGGHAIGSQSLRAQQLAEARKPGTHANHSGQSTRRYPDLYRHCPRESDHSTHVSLMGTNTLGFEDSFNTGDADIDDIIAKITGVSFI
jgi:hypothetical protein